MIFWRCLRPRLYALALETSKVLKTFEVSKSSDNASILNAAQHPLKNR
jgi:hypothetical protein